MAISGTWAARAANAGSYTGALRWGTGIDPIHALRDNPGRVTGIKENLYPLGDISDAVPDQILGPDDYVDADWDGGAVYPGEDYRYQDTEPRWGTPTETFRDATSSEVMGEWDEWGPEEPWSDEFPLGGPTRGMDVALDVSHGEDQERQHSIATPGKAVAGAWRNKARSPDITGTTSDGQVPGDLTAQWAVGTGFAQGPGIRSLDNSRALARGTDVPREAVLSRTAGLRQYVPGTSFKMGGGPTTPDMFPFQQTPGLKRPFVARAAGLPPAEEHYWNEMESRMPLQRTVPPDPYQGDPETAGATGGTGDIYEQDSGWGY